MQIFTTFEQALAFWTRRHGLNNDSIWDEFHDAERMLLSHPPRCNIEAAAIVDVLLQQGDARCDGLDQVALTNLGGFLRDAPAPLRLVA